MLDEGLLCIPAETAVTLQTFICVSSQVFLYTFLFMVPPCT
jgi:hypothetical protein